MAVCGQGCSPSPQSRQTANLPLPNKDEIALVNGRPLTLSNFINIRQTLKNQPPQMAFWAGTTALAFQDELRAKGREIPLSAAFEVVQYSLGLIPALEDFPLLNDYFGSSRSLPSPEIIRQELETISKRSSIIRNPIALSQIY